jgi:hypothetical protein
VGLPEGAGGLFKQEHAAEQSGGFLQVGSGGGRGGRERLRPGLSPTRSASLPAPPPDLTRSSPFPSLGTWRRSAPSSTAASPCWPTRARRGGNACAGRKGGREERREGGGEGKREGSAWGTLRGPRSLTRPPSLPWPRFPPSVEVLLTFLNTDPSAFRAWLYDTTAVGPSTAAAVGLTGREGGREGGGDKRRTYLHPPKPHQHLHAAGPGGVQLSQKKERHHHHHHRHRHHHEGGREGGKEEKRERAGSVGCLSTTSVSSEGEERGARGEGPGAGWGPAAAASLEVGAESPPCPLEASLNPSSTFITVSVPFWRLHRPLLPVLLPCRLLLPPLLDDPPPDQRHGHR